MCHDSPSESDSEINIGNPGMGIPGMDMSVSWYEWKKMLTQQQYIKSLVKLSSKKLY